MKSSYLFKDLNNVRMELTETYLRQLPFDHAKGEYWAGPYHLRLSSLVDEKGDLELYVTITNYTKNLQYTQRIDAEVRTLEQDINDDTDYEQDYYLRIGCGMFTEEQYKKILKAARAAARKAKRKAK